MAVCTLSNGLEIFFLVICMLFNLVNLVFYITISGYLCKRYHNGDTRQSIPTTTHYVVNEKVSEDVAQVHTVSTISAYSTNTVRGNQALMAVTVSTSFFLMALNIYYNTVVTPSNPDAPSNVDGLEWAILICYAALLLVGIFPSNDVITRSSTPEEIDLAQQNPANEPKKLSFCTKFGDILNKYLHNQHPSTVLRTWNILCCCRVPINLSGSLHLIGALTYLLVPTCINIHLNEPDMQSRSHLYYGFAIASLVISLLFFFIQFVVLFSPVSTQVDSPQSAFLHVVSYFVELVAFPLATAQYVIVELNSILSKCS